MDPSALTEFSKAPDSVWFLKSVGGVLVKPSSEPDADGSYWWYVDRAPRSADLVVVHPIEDGTGKSEEVQGDVAAGYSADGETRTTASGTWLRFKKLPLAETRRRLEAAGR